MLGLKAQPIRKRALPLMELPRALTPPFRSAQELDQPEGIQVEDGGSSGLFAEAGRVAGHGEDRANPQQAGAHQVGLQAEQVTVPAGDVGNHLDPDVALDDARQGDVAHPDPRQRVFGEVYRVRPRLLQCPATGENLAAVKPLWGVQFHGNYLVLAPAAKKVLFPGSRS